MTQSPTTHRAVPTGTVTFLFSDIEGSTRLLDAMGDDFAAALAEHRRIVRHAVATNNGVEIDTAGDSFFIAFARASDAVAAAVESQIALSGGPVKVRMGLHTGEPLVTAEGYVGMVVHRAARIASAAYGGQILLSKAAASLLHELPREVGVRELGAFRLKDLTDPEVLYQVLHPGLQEAFPPLRPFEAPPNNLPQQLTTFIGREKAIGEIKALLGRTRLLTLTGSGGSGKTRLSLQVAADELQRFADGAWIVELAALADPGLVAQTAANVLGVREQPGTPMSMTLAEHLKTRQLLLILDNCEHLLEPCAALANQLLLECPNISILASSREPLGIGGEQTYRVPSLSLPDATRMQTPQSLSTYESVRLFIDRARLVRPDFEVDNRNAPAVASLCQHLDGIPLAIELAAARVRSLAVEDIDRKLDHRFRLLTGGSRAALPRQQTLRSLVDWSYDLLRDEEKKLLRRISVFAGGFGLAAAERVVSDDEIAEEDVLDLLTSLCDKSLAFMDTAAGPTRYGLLETIRQYARDRLCEAGEEAVWRGRHLDYFLAFADAAGEQRDQRVWLDRLESEHDNIRSALWWASAPGGNPTSGLRLGDAMWRFWVVRGYSAEGREWLRAILNTDPDTQDRLTRANALQGAAELARVHFDYAAARSLNEESLSIRQALQDRRGVVASLNCLGLVAVEEGDYAAAKVKFEEALIGIREIGEPWGTAMTLAFMGTALRHQKEFSGARANFEEALAIAQDLDDRMNVAFLVRSLGTLAHAEGDLVRAGELYARSLCLHRDLGNRGGIAGSLNSLARLALDLGRTAPAITLLGAEKHLRDEAVLPLAPKDRDFGQQFLDRARAAMEDEAAFDCAWREGLALPLEDAIELALREAVVQP
ncbi:MAG: tetratricopeptide repeat protein [Burkholderiales bacterium]